jgi:hypothetical protein
MAAIMIGIVFKRARAFWRFLVVVEWVLGNIWKARRQNWREWKASNGKGQNLKMDWLRVGKIKFTQIIQIDKEIIHQAIANRDQKEKRWQESVSVFRNIP